MAFFTLPAAGALAYPIIQAATSQVGRQVITQSVRRMVQTMLRQMSKWGMDPKAVVRASSSIFSKSSNKDVLREAGKWYKNAMNAAKTKAPQHSNKYKAVGKIGNKHLNKLRKEVNKLKDKEGFGEVAALEKGATQTSGGGGRIFRSDLGKRSIAPSRQGTLVREKPGGLLVGGAGETGGQTATRGTLIRNARKATREATKADNRARDMQMAASHQLDRANLMSKQAVDQAKAKAEKIIRETTEKATLTKNRGAANKILQDGRRKAEKLREAADEMENINFRAGILSGKGPSPIPRDRAMVLRPDRRRVRLPTHREPLGPIGKTADGRWAFDPYTPPTQDQGRLSRIGGLRGLGLLGGGAVLGAGLTAAASGDDREQAMARARLQAMGGGGGGGGGAPVDPAGEKERLQTLLLRIKAMKEMADLQGGAGLQASKDFSPFASVY